MSVQFALEAVAKQQSGGTSERQRRILSEDRALIEEGVAVFG